MTTSPYAAPARDQRSALEVAFAESRVRIAQDVERLAGLGAPRDQAIPLAALEHDISAYYLEWLVDCHTSLTREEVGHAAS